MKKILLPLFFMATLLVNAQEWQTDFEQAKKIAKEKNKNIVLVFEGSDWCAPCKKLNKEIFSTDKFKAYSKEHFVLLKADFPKKKKNKLTKTQQAKNYSLADKYNHRGFFPLVVVLNNKGDVLGETGYAKVTPAKYIQLLTSF